MTVRTLLVAASLATLPLLAPSRAAAWNGSPPPAITVTIAPPPTFAPAPPPTFVPPPPTFAPPPPAWGPRAVRAACVARFGPDPWRVSRCESRWLALRPVPGPRWAVAGWRGHGRGHHDD